MQQAAATLINALREGGGGCHRQVGFAHSDTLIAGGLDLGSGFSRGLNWMEHLARTKHDGNDQEEKREKLAEIVILTAGAHVYGKSNYEHLILNVIAQIQGLKQWMPGVTVIWKTQAPAGCSDAQHPDTEHHPFEIARTTKERDYNWNEFFERDEWTINQMQQNRIPFLDVRMLYARTEAHPNYNPIRDCLHFCAPGPLDVVPQLFQRLLTRNFETSPCIGMI